MQQMWRPDRDRFPSGSGADSDANANPSADTRADSDARADANPNAREVVGRLYGTRLARAIACRWRGPSARGSREAPQVKVAMEIQSPDIQRASDQFALLRAEGARVYHLHDSRAIGAVESLASALLVVGFGLLALSFVIVGSRVAGYKKGGGR